MDMAIRFKPGTTMSYQAYCKVELHIGYDPIASSLPMTCSAD